MMDGLGWFASVLKYWVPLRCKTRCGILARWEWRLLTLGLELPEERKGRCG